MDTETRLLDLLIINPAASRGVYGILGDNLVAREPPLWARLIAGYVRDRAYSVEIIDAEAEQCLPEEIHERVLAKKPRLIAIIVFGHQPSASTQQMFGAREIAQALAGCGHPMIMIGGHVAALPEQTLREEPVDYTCNGEGPVTVVGLLNDLPSKDIPGLVWRDMSGGVRSNPRAKMLEDLDKDLHGNAWDLLPMHLYYAHNWQCFDDLSKRHPYASIYTTLNCPYKCSFCCISSPFGNNRYLARDPAKVVEEIAMLYYKYNVRTFKIVDEMFILRERHYMAIANGLIACGFEEPINIWAYARVDTVKPDTLKTLKAAGFKWLALGIESGSKHVRDGADKALKSEDIVGTVKAIQAAGINVIGNYIFGLRDDTMETMGETLNLAFECNTEFANFYSAMAYPGSRLYDEALAEGWTLPDEWRGYSQHNYYSRPLDTEHVPAEVVLKFRDDAFDAYFSRKEYQDMILEKFGPETLEHIKVMLTYKLKRRLLEPANVLS